MAMPSLPRSGTSCWLGLMTLRTRGGTTTARWECGWLLAATNWRSRGRQTQRTDAPPLSLERMYPVVLGANVGTCLTGLIAAMAVEPGRLRPALQVAHML